MNDTHRPATYQAVFLLFLVLLMCTVRPLPAQETETLMQMSLQEILKINVQTTTKTSMTLREAPGTVYSFSQDDFRQHGIQSVDNLYWCIPSVQPYNYKKNHVVVIRGVIERFNSRTLHLVDDVVIRNGFYNHEEFDAFIPLEWIESYEMVLGPGSSLYGAGAFSGISSIRLLGFSAAPELKISVNSLFDPSLPQGTATYRDKHISMGVTGAGGDFPHPEKNLNGSAFDQLTEARWFHGFAKANLWNKGYAFVRGGMQERPYLNNSAGAKVLLRKNPLIFGLQLNLGEDSKRGLWSLKANHSIQNYDEWSKLEEREESQNASFTDVDFTYNRIVRSVNLLLGSTYRREKAEDMKTVDGATLVQESGVVLNNVALYAQSIADLTWRLHLTLGLRYDSFDRFDDQLNGRAALVFKSGTHSFFKALAGTAIRTPSHREWNKKMEGTSFVQPMVKPEEIATYELSVNQVFGNLYFDVTGFHNTFTNMLLERNTPPTSDDPEGGADEYFYNSDKTVQTRGVEVGMRAKAGGLIVTGGYSFTDTDDGSGKANPYIRKHKFDLNASFNYYRSHHAVIGLAAFSKAEDENDARFMNDEPAGFVYFHAALDGRITPALSYVVGARNFGGGRTYDPYYRSGKYVNVQRLDRRIWAGLKYSIAWR